MLATWDIRRNCAAARRCCGLVARLRLTRARPVKASPPAVGLLRPVDRTQWAARDVRADPGSETPQHAATGQPGVGASLAREADRRLGDRGRDSDRAWPSLAARARGIARAHSYCRAPSRRSQAGLPRPGRIGQASPRPRPARILPSLRSAAKLAAARRFPSSPISTSAPPHQAKQLALAGPRAHRAGARQGGIQRLAAASLCPGPRPRGAQAQRGLLLQLITASADCPRRRQHQERAVCLVRTVEIPVSSAISADASMDIHVVGAEPRQPVPGAAGPAWVLLGARTARSDDGGAARLARLRRAVLSAPPPDRARFRQATRSAQPFGKGETQAAISRAQPASARSSTGTARSGYADALGRRQGSRAQPPPPRD